MFDVKVKDYKTAETLGTYKFHAVPRVGEFFFPSLDLFKVIEVSHVVKNSDIANPVIYVSPVRT